MPESSEPQAVVEAAQLAADAGDYASAEQLLREAVRRQEADAGPLNPDLANTLNNLGVVCELRNKAEDAERCYRQAYAIAAAVLEPDHPFVATSRQNLTDFCEARGKPTGIEPPAPAPAAVEQAGIDAGAPAHARAASRPFALTGFSRSYRIVALSLCGLVLVMLAALRPSSGTGAQPSSAPLPAAAVVAPAAFGSTPNVGPAREPPAGPAVPIVARGAAATRNRRPAPAASRAARSPAPPAIASARMCRTLSIRASRDSAGDWRCDAANRPIEPGSLFFYTRLKSASDTTVEHRWYRGERLHQAVELRVRANPVDGYRTYSRSTMSARSAGDWRVELRSRNGALLHEERFVVR